MAGPPTTLNEQRLNLALKAGGLASWDWDVAAGTVIWSDEHYRIQGYRPGTVVPSLKAWLERVHPEDRDEAVRVLTESQRAHADYVHRFRCLWPDGTVRHCAARGLHFYDAVGNPVRMIGVMEDITDQIEAENALRDSESRFRQFGDASSDVLWIRDAATLELEYLSRAYARIYGVEQDARNADSSVETWLSRVLVDDRPALHAAIQRVRAGERVVTEYRIRRGDGEIRWMRNTQFPLRDEAGRIVRIGGIGHDATEERRASEAMHAMLAELQHRTSNLMAVVESVTQRTLRDSTSLDAFRTTFADRLSAIARVHGLLSSLHGGDRIAIDTLLREEFAAQGIDATRVRLEGPAGRRLRSSTVQTLALALHELASTSVNHGALASPAGVVQVSWHDTVWQDGSPGLMIEWLERADPDAPLHAHRAAAYGRELVERALPYQLDARTSYASTPQGMRCVIELPLGASPR